MSRRISCTACTFIKNGVKTRKNIPHSCEKTDKEIRELIKKVKDSAGRLFDDYID
jgi:hypothetical protein